ncbi:MAG: ABC transporter permease [Clostridiales bacterium]|jgi:spermidine/putrescine transport system permease protein|nr:ABC transporter permease [Clostridiales bacterium]
MKSKSGAIAAVLPMYIFTLAFVLGPLIYMLVMSFLARGASWGITTEVTPRNYLHILQPAYLKTFTQSLRLALLTTGLAILFGYPFGYFMARLSPKSRDRCMLLLIIPFWTNSLLRLYGWMIIFRANGPLDVFLMGLNITHAPLKLLYTYPAVAVGMIYALLPFMIYSVYASAEKMDWSLVEASRDLGASSFRAFLTVTLPLTMPGLYSGIILTFIPSMGLYFIADLLGGNKIVLVGNLIQEQLMRVHDWPFAAALSVILMLMTTLFLFVYRKITRAVGSADSKLEGLV